MANEWNLGEKKTALVQEIETAIIVGVISDKYTEKQSLEHLAELDFLATTAGAVIKKRFVQKLKSPNSRTFVGKGKAEEILEYVQANEIDIIIFDDDLSGKQTNILEEIMECKILDRSTLILDIFANRAQTAQAKAQVEMAQMKYMLPRLRGMWTHLERQKGGIGMRGPGEQEIETDRRIIRKKISMLKAKLEKIDMQAQTRRKNRGDMIRVALVGYTNVGKSTLMNVLGKADVLVQNKLFATLDTTVRKVVVDRMPFLLSDTVGFIRKLPHHLVESFKSTLDEVREADLLIHVIDVSHPQYKEQLAVVQATLKDLGAEKMPVLYIFNKMDLYLKNNLDEFLLEEEKVQLINELKQHWQMKTQNNACFITALDKTTLVDLKIKLKDIIDKLYIARYPYKTRFW